MPNGNTSTEIALTYPFPAERVFRYQAMQEVLSVLIEQPYDEFTISELATLIEGNQATVSKAVKLLAAVGVVETHREGRKQYVSINRARLTKPDPFLSIPQVEFQKPVRAFVNRIREEVDELVGVVLFGSVARGEADRVSDIDLLIIVAGDKTAGRRAAQSIIRDLQQTKFDGNRYSFQPLVESTASARRIGERLRPQFRDGITLVDSDALAALRLEVLSDGE
ncbi:MULTISPECIES: nucleotidyltransferase domain-containing protein [unclassified Haladaptatus]|uniref:nucleotidyltransferase domain-containing protein n=1 Tax=unclassified Haladaptatus TaxID=2622732 RepID=UPI0023E8780C|nr:MULTISPECIES: nucleotidyltransferase domain-containing protein [unclassified Haladaptatus]